MAELEPIDFFVPGPSWVREEVRAAMTKPVEPHRSPAFRDLYASLQPRLEKVFRTSDDIYVATGSSTLALEAAVASTVRSKVLNTINGAFSQRWHDICLARGLDATRLDHPWGEPVDAEAVREAVRDAVPEGGYEAVTITHNETSTGVMSDLDAISRAVREESDALILADAVSSLGGAPVETDTWDLDWVVAGTQKGLALPPGLAIFTASERAIAAAEHVAHRGYYTDLLRYRDKHRAGGTITTPAVPLVYALDRQLDLILDEGIEARWQRHKALYERTAAWAPANGFEYASRADGRSWTTSCLRPPEGFPAPDLVAELARRGFRVGSGYGAWKASTFRIGHMGDVQLQDLERLLSVISEIVDDWRNGA